MRGFCVYPFVSYLMAKRGIDFRTLSAEVGISYTTLRRKMRGLNALTFEDALSIKKFLGPEIELEKIFEKGETKDEVE